MGNADISKFASCESTPVPVWGQIIHTCYDDVEYVEDDRHDPTSNSTSV